MCENQAEADATSAALIRVVHDGPCGEFGAFEPEHQIFMETEIRAIFAAREVPARMSWQLGEALLYIVEERSKRMAESGRLALVSALVLIGTDVQQGLCADCRVLDAFPDLLRADGALTREAEMWITSHRAVWNKHRCQVMRWLLALCRLEIGTFQYDDAFGDFDAGEHPRCDHKRFLKSVRGAFRGHDEVRSLIHRILG